MLKCIILFIVIISWSLSCTEKEKEEPRPTIRIIINLKDTLNEPVTKTQVDVITHKEKSNSTSYFHNLSGPNYLCRGGTDTSGVYSCTFQPIGK